jgi:hypothetical protein
VYLTVKPVGEPDAGNRHVRLGSDDDEFVFHCADRTVRVPFSPEYLNAI